MSRAALCALLLATLPAEARVRYRIGPEIRLGGAAQSDLFVGAQAGADFSLFAAPSLRSDFALSPGSRVYTAYTFGFGRYFATALSSLSHSLSLEWREQLTPGAGLQLLMLASRVGFAGAGGAVSPDTPSLAVGSAWSLAAAPSVRLELGGGNTLVGYYLERSFSDAAGGEVRETWHNGIASHRISLAGLALEATYRLSLASTNRGFLSHLGNGLGLDVAGSAWEGASWLAGASGQIARYDDGRRDLSWHAQITLQQALWDGIILEATYSYAQNRSTLDAYDGARHHGYLGLLAAFWPWRG